MRKVIIGVAATELNVGLESLEVDPAINTEEAVDNYQEMAEAEQEIKEASMECYTLATRIAALEDIAQVLDEQVQEARPSEVVLVDIATDMAVEGTDMEDQDVTPGLESAVGKTVSTEGIKETITRFKNAIKERMQSAKERFRALMGSQEAMIGLEKKRIKEVIDALNSKENVEFKAVDAGNLLMTLSPAGKVPANVADLIGVGKSLKAQTNTIYTKCATDYTNLIAQYVAAVKGNDSVEAIVRGMIEAAKKVAGKFSSMTSYGKVPNSLPLKGEDYIGTNGKYGLCSGWRLAKAGFDEYKKDGEYKQAARDLGEVCKFMDNPGADQSVLKKAVKGKSFEFKTKAEVENTLKAALELLTEIEKSIGHLDKMIDEADELWASWYWYANNTEPGQNEGTFDRSVVMYTIMGVTMSTSAYLSYSTKLIRSAGALTSIAKKAF